MYRKLVAFALVLTFVLSSVSLSPIQSVFAHTTVGDPVPPGRARATHVTIISDNLGNPLGEFATNTGRSRHVAGPTGYVFPGSGQIGLQARAFPAFRDPNEELQGGAVKTSNIFSPSAAILTSTAAFRNKGDLILALNFTTKGLVNPDIITMANIACSNTAAGTAGLSADDTLVTEAQTVHREGLRSLRYRSMTIYVPPEFTPPVDWASQDNSNIGSTMTDDFTQITVYKASRFDPFGPSWWVILFAVREDLVVFNLRFGSTNPEAPPAPGFTFIGIVPGITAGNCPQRLTGPNTQGLWMEDRWHYVRLNEMTAPEIAGEYFFKMFLNATYAPSVTGKTYCDIGLGNISTDGSSTGTFVGPVCSDQVRGGGTGVTGSKGTLSSNLQTVPAQNWPSLLVKAEVDPAVILGTIRHSGIQNTTLFGQSVKLPCKVVAEGTAIDPITGKPTGRRVTAWGFTNATRLGRYEVQGLAAGTYRLTASCAGYPRLTLDREITVQRGQSLHGVDFFLRPGAILAGKVNSKLIEDPNVVVPWTSVPLLSDADSSSLRRHSILAPDPRRRGCPTGALDAATGRKVIADVSATGIAGDPGFRDCNTQRAFDQNVDIRGLSFDPNQPSSSVTGNIANRNDWNAVCVALAKGCSRWIQDAGEASSGTKDRATGAGSHWKPVYVEIYDAAGALVSYSPRNGTNPPFSSYTWDNMTILYQRVAFPWESTIGPAFHPFGVHNGVGPAAAVFSDGGKTCDTDVGIWWARSYFRIIGIQNTMFCFQFGNLPGQGFSDGFGVYGAPTSYDGHVPQTFATWVDGLAPGTYSIRVWINGYVQLQNFTFVVPSFEVPGVVNREIDVFRTSLVNLLVHFSDTSGGTLVTNPIGGPDPGRYIIVRAIDSRGRLAAYNFSWVQANTTDYTVQLSGFGLHGPEIHGIIRCDPTGQGGLSFGSGGDYTSPFGGVFGSKGAFFPISAQSIVGPRTQPTCGPGGFYFWNNFPQRKSPLPFMRFSLFDYTGDQDYGMLPGTYRFEVYIRGYVQKDFPSATIGFGGLPANLSFTLLRGGGVNMTVNSKDSESPPQRIPWRWGDFFFAEIFEAVNDQAKVAAGFFPLCRNRITAPLGAGIAAQCQGSGETVQVGDVNIGKTFQGSSIAVGTILPSVGSSIYHYLELVRPDGSRVTYPEVSQVSALTGAWFEGSQASQVTSRPGIDPSTRNIVFGVGLGFPFIDCATRTDAPGGAACSNTAAQTAATHYDNFPIVKPRFGRHFIISNIAGAHIANAGCPSSGRSDPSSSDCAPGPADHARTRDAQDFGMGFTSYVITTNVGTFNGSWVPDRWGPDGAVFFARSSPQTFTSTSSIPDASYGKEGLGLGVFFPPLGVNDYSGFLADARKGTAQLAFMGLDSGLYQPSVDTYGYVTTPESRLSVSLTRGSSLADIKTDVFAGAVIRAVVAFKTQDLFADVPSNMFFRLVVTDKKGNVVAEDHSGRFEAGRFDRQPTFRFGAIPAPSPDRTTGVRQYRFLIAGFIPSPTTSVYPTIDMGSGKSGIPDGTYNINLEVYFASRAAPTRTATARLTGQPSTGPGTTEPNGFPPGLMQGYPWYGGYRPGFGPYEQRGTVSATVTRFPGTGVTTVIFELDRLGTVRGLVLGFNQQGDLRTVSWSKVSASGSPAVAQPTFDGTYEIFLQPGTYTLSATEYDGNIGHTSKSVGLSVTIGSDQSGIDFQLPESGIPIPEFPALATLLMLVAAMATSLVILRRSKRLHVPAVSAVRRAFGLTPA